MGHAPGRPRGHGGVSRPSSAGQLLGDMVCTLCRRIAFNHLAVCHAEERGVSLQSSRHGPDSGADAKKNPLFHGHVDFAGLKPITKELEQKRDNNDLKQLIVFAFQP